jgi:hypothetical protein
MGLHWLAAPVAAFVRRYPRAEIAFYPGDLSIAALRTFPVLFERAPQDARAIADIDFTEMVDHWKKIDPPLAAEISELLSKANALCRAHS